MLAFLQVRSGCSEVSSIDADESAVTRWRPATNALRLSANRNTVHFFKVAGTLRVP